MSGSTEHDPATLFTAHRERVRRALVRIVGEAEADDLTQDVFVRVTRALPEFRGESNIATWILRIARGIGLDHLRSRRHHKARRTVSLSPVAEAAGMSSPVAEPHEEALAPRRQALRRELERGCDFYRNEDDALACDRKNPGPVFEKSVSLAQTISSKEVRPIARARRAKAVALAANVKETPARNILKLAGHLTQPGSESASASCAAPAPGSSAGCGCS